MVEKVKKAIAIKGPTFVHIIAPCTIGWRIESNMTIQMAKLAVQTGVFPLFEIENGIFKMTSKQATRKPVLEYLKHQGRFKNLTEAEVKLIQKNVDERYKFYESLETKGQIFEQIR
jgi:pyruvate ferredoxin oxidoreductase beta subunit